MIVFVSLAAMVGIFVLILTVMSMDSKLKKMAENQEKLLQLLLEKTSGNDQYPKH